MKKRIIYAALCAVAMDFQLGLLGLSIVKFSTSIESIKAAGNYTEYLANSAVLFLIGLAVFLAFFCGFIANVTKLWGTDERN